MKASASGLGSVFITRHRAGRGPLGWYGNEHNPADGWYWCQATRLMDPDVRGPVMKRRKDVQRDAESVFDNIVGWKSEHNGHDMHALVKP